MADQLRGVYRWDTNMRKRKWWWSILFWCMQMLQTNAYIAYCKYMKMHDKEHISHLDFCKKITFAWLDPHNNWPKKIFILSRCSKASLSTTTSECGTSMTTRSVAAKKAKKKRA